MNIILAADHAGFELKEQIRLWLSEQGYSVEDCGAYTFDAADDYPIYMHRAAEKLYDAVHNHNTEPLQSCAIVLGGSGTGEAIVMNRYRGIRAVVYNGQDVDIVRLARSHNDANVLSIGARFVRIEQVFSAIGVFMDTAFEAGRHQSRVRSIEI